jgi:hypothetical protein
MTEAKETILYNPTKTSKDTRSSRKSNKPKESKSWIGRIMSIPVASNLSISSKKNQNKPTPQTNLSNP